MKDLTRITWASRWDQSQNLFAIINTRSKSFSTFIKSFFKSRTRNSRRGYVRRSVFPWVICCIFIQGSSGAQGLFIWMFVKAPYNDNLITIVLCLQHWMKHPHHPSTQYICVALGQWPMVIYHYKSNNLFFNHPKWGTIRRLTTKHHFSLWQMRYDYHTRVIARMLNKSRTHRKPSWSVFFPFLFCTQFLS